MRTFLDALRFALRRLRREPLAGVSAMLTLGLGLGVTAALVTVARSVLLSAPPVRSVEELVVLRPRVTAPGGAAREAESWSYPMFEELRRSLDAGRAGASAAVAAFTPQPRRVNFGVVQKEGMEDRAARQLRLEMVSASYLDVLGVRPFLGRGLVPDDDAPGSGHAVVLLGHELWQSEFGGDPSVIGRRVSIERLPFEVVGVLPPRFAGLSESAEAWVPMASAPALTFPRRLTGALSFWHGVVMRRQDRDVAEWTVALDRAATAIAEAIPLQEVFGPGQLALATKSFLEARRDPALGRTLSLLLLLAGAVLTVAAVNVAHLVLARVTARAAEISTLRALGARRTDAWRRHLAEATLLGVGALASGLLFVPAVLGLVDRYRPQRVEEALGTLEFDGGLFAVAVAIAALLIVGLAAFGAAGERALARRQTSFAASGVAREAGGARLRSAFVVTQLAMVLVTALAAVAALRGLQQLYERPLGFAADSTLTLRVALPRSGYDEDSTLAFFSRAAERLSALPGVEAASAANCLPLSDACDIVGVRLEEAATSAGAGETLQAALNMIDPAYPRALGLAVRSGRGFTAADRAGAPSVVLVDRTAERVLWPGRSAIGQRLAVTVGWPESGFAEVVGVVDDVPEADLLRPARPGIYLPLQQFRYREAFFVVRFAGRGDGLASAATRAVQEIDPNVAVFDVASLAERVRRTGAARRFGAVLLGILGALASALAGLGVYAVMGYAVGRRRREFAVRAAFGARAGQLQRQVLASGVRLIGFGLALGGALSLVLHRLLIARLEGAVPVGPGLFALAAIWVAALALLAAWLPARRASRVDPARALREE